MQPSLFVHTYHLHLAKAQAPQQLRAHPPECRQHECHSAAHHHLLQGHANAVLGARRERREAGRTSGRVDSYLWVLPALRLELTRVWAPVDAVVVEHKQGGEQVHTCWHDVGSHPCRLGQHTNTGSSERGMSAGAEQMRPGMLVSTGFVFYTLTIASWCAPMPHHTHTLARTPSVGGTPKAHAHTLVMLMRLQGTAAVPH
jgi:hypothetical protein